MNTHDKISRMQEGGRKLGVILRGLLSYARPGITLADIEAQAQKRIREAGGSPSFMTVEDYKWATCLCVNEVIVHGIPTSYALREGDLLTIDIGMLYEGYHTDTAWTKVVSESNTDVARPGREGRGKARDEEVELFLSAGQEALWKAVGMAREGNRIGHISRAIQSVIQPRYGIVKTLVGHGIGKTLHEPPQIPGVLTGSVEKTWPIVDGMTIAVEVIYTMGDPKVTYINNDGWSIATSDHSISAVFEHTIAVTPDGPVILTKADQYDTIGS